MNRTEYDEMMNCEHMGADWIEWGNLIDSEGRGECPDCGAILESIQIETGYITTRDGEELDNFNTELFCHTCDKYDEEGCEECHTCCACVEKKAKHECGEC
jgi:hypothetical protein